MAADLDEDHCFKRFDEWLALEQWERDAQPDEDPACGGALEDCEYWRHKAFAALSISLPLIRAHIADGLRESPDLAIHDAPINYGNNESHAYVSGYTFARDTLAARVARGGTD
jgi:hypothetical protein